MRGKRYDGHHFFCIIGNNVIVDRQLHDLGIKQKSVIELDASSKESGVWTGHGWRCLYLS